MKRFCWVVCAVLALALGAPAAQEKAPAPEKKTRSLKVKLNYTGSGKVDGQHNIIVFIFDSPDFMQGSGMPFGRQTATAKGETITFADFEASPVYIVGVYDPKGEYDGQSGPPPSGASMGLYSKTPGTPEPIKIEAGKTGDIELTFDDTQKMP